MRKEIEKILVDILLHELQVPPDYGVDNNGNTIPSIIIYAQNIKLFNTNKLQITVRTVDAHNYSNRIEYIENPNQDPDLDGKDAFLEVQDINQSRMMQIDVYSRNNEARQRFHEVAMALNSTYARQQMDLYNFKLGAIGNAVNISGIDGGSDINRFTYTFNVIIHFQKSKPIDYYNQFPTTLDNEQGRISEFTITTEKTNT